MVELKSGNLIELLNGGSIKILKEIGRGGQGSVFGRL